MESLTSCQVNRTRVAVRTVKRDTAAPGMESLTSCQANRTRVAVRTVRRDTAAPGKKSLTICQTNKTSIGMMSMRKINVSVVITHPLLSHQFQNVVNEKTMVIVHGSLTPYGIHSNIPLSNIALLKSLPIIANNIISLLNVELVT